MYISLQLLALRSCRLYLACAPACTNWLGELIRFPRYIQRHYIVSASDRVRCGRGLPKRRVESVLSLRYYSRPVNATVAASNVQLCQADLLPPLASRKQ